METYANIHTNTNMMMIPSESNFYTAFSLRVFLFNFFVFKPLTKQTTADYKDAQTAEFSERKHNKQKTKQT